MLAHASQTIDPMFRHPVWLLGFRPLFLLAALSGALLVPIWAAAFAGAVVLPADGLPALAWHAHEMFYGFGFAVLGGFLLTASRNWLKIRGMHGGLLAFATLLWLAERAAVFVPPSTLRFVLLNAFAACVFGYVLYTLVRFFRNGSPQNAWFVVTLPIFFVAKNLLVSPSQWTVGVAMTVGLFRLPFALMLERLLPMFMRNALGVELPRHRRLDDAIKALLLAAVFTPFVPPIVGAVLAGAAALLLLLRFVAWKPHVALRRVEIGVLYVGYAGLVVHLLLEALHLSIGFTGVGTLATHAFTLLVMGPLIAAMMLRVSMGHTGRPIVYGRADRIALGSMAIAAFFRLIATQIWPAAYSAWIACAAAFWSLCYAIVLVRLSPMLLAPRVDGREV